MHNVALTASSALHDSRLLRRGTDTRVGAIDDMRNAR